MSNGLLSPDDMMLDNVSPGPYVSAPIFGLLSGAYQSFLKPGKVWSGEYGVGSIDNPAFMQAAQDFTMDYGVLPAIGGAVLAPAAQNTLRMGGGGGRIRTYHGSPHDFPPAVRVRDTQTGKTYVQEADDPVSQAFMKQFPERYEIIEENPLGMFDLSKMGTGEGAQAFGRGAYLSEVEGVAKQYRDTLSNREKLTYKGKDVASPEMINDEQSRLLVRAYFLRRNEFDSPAKAVASELRDLKLKLKAMNDPGAFERAKIAYKNDPNFSKSETTKEIGFNIDDEIKSMRKFERETLEREIRLLEEVDLNKLEASGGGHMYEAEILASPEQFLDYDAPILNQPKEIQEGVAKALEAQGRTMSNWQISPTASGKRFYVIHPAGYVTQGYPNAMSKAKAQQIVDAENAQITGAQYIPRTEVEREALLKAGIPGVKYKAGGYRRELPEGEIKRNFVVFDDALINILRKYGLLAPMATGAAIGSGLLDVDAEGNRMVY